MLPGPDALDRDVSEAEAEVSRADAQVRASYGALKQRFRDRLPWLAGAGIGIAIYLLLPRSRRTPRSAWAVAGRSPWSSLTVSLLNLLVSRGIGPLTAVIAAMVARKPARPLATVAHVDLDRYAGMWFEIARMPTRAEDRCECDVTATYAVTDSGLSVINRCRRADGRIRSAVGRARVVEDRTNARLQISFAPSFLDALPFVWGDYWILDLADDYDAAMVGTPDRKHLWLLSRTPSLPGTELSAFIARANQQGFDTARLLYTEQTVRQAPSAPARQTNGEGLLSAQAPREIAESRAG
jgi:apolipoprotein D and lipocalin family protein